MSDIQAIIRLIEEGSSNSDHRDGQRQINEAVAMLRKMQEDSHLHSGQRWKLSQILGCRPLHKDIKAAVKGMKEAAAKPMMIQVESNLLFSQRYKLSKILECKCCYDDIERAVRGLKEKQQWQSIETAPKDEFVVCIRPSLESQSGWWSAVLIYTDGEWVDSRGKAFSPLYWMPIFKSQLLAEPE